jgi:hypothetical protein
MVKPPFYYHWILLDNITYTCLFLIYCTANPLKYMWPNVPNKWLKFNTHVTATSPQKTDAQDQQNRILWQNSLSLWGDIHKTSTEHADERDKIWSRRGTSNLKHGSNKCNHAVSYMNMTTEEKIFSRNT